MKKLFIFLCIFLLTLSSCAPRKIDSFYKPSSKIGIYVEFSTEDFERRYQTPEGTTSIPKDSDIIGLATTILQISDISRFFGDTNKVITFYKCVENTSIFISSNIQNTLISKGYEPNILLIENKALAENDKEPKLEFFTYSRQKDLNKYKELSSEKDLDGIIHIRYKIQPIREQQLVFIRSKLITFLEITLVNNENKIVYENLFRSEKILEKEFPKLLEDPKTFEEILVNSITNIKIDLFN